MNPESVLNEIENQIEQGDMEEAVYAAANYAVWRERGGFASPEQDERFAKFQEQLKDIVLDNDK